MSFKGHRYFRGRITRKNAIQRESDIQLQILKYLRVIGAYAGKTRMMGYKHPSGRWILDPYNFVGFPDLSCFYNNKFYFIECKALGNKQSPAQKKFQQYCEISGINYILAFCIEDIILALRKDGHNV